MKKSIAMLTLALSLTSSFAGEYECVGTEPFWGAQITENKLLVDDFESSTSQEIISRQTAAGVGNEFVFVVKTKNQSLTVVTGECSDGMSDTIYSHHAVLDRSNARVLYGCCKKVK